MDVGFWETGFFEVLELEFDFLEEVFLLEVCFVVAMEKLIIVKRWRLAKSNPGGNDDRLSHESFG